jgi:pimeloyl-ACP methyl ester carboxylesterase
MDYQQYRASLIKGYYDHQLEALMSRFDPDRKTVILLPGGMGSQLERTEHAYPATPNVINDVVWLDLGIAPPKYDARKMEIDDAGKDKEGFVVAAHGPVSFFTETPYGELEDHARARGWNYGVFGFDWRRPLTESSGYFKSFILDFRQRVRSDFGKKRDPIPKLTIIGHSMGGLVCTDALRDARFSGLGFNAVMTIGTPFYGTSTHQDRYFIGVSLLNRLYKGEGGARNVVRIVASLPGPYTLMFLSKTVYDRDHAKIGLDRYPQFDPDGNVSDPFDRAMMRRWPKVVRDHWQYIDGSRNEMVAIAAPINANIAPKFFNVRSALDTRTAVELIWNDIDGDRIDPAVGPSPLAGLAGPGDGTVPAWSAFHAYCKNRHDLKQAKDHATLLEHEEVLTLIEGVVTTGKLSTGRRRPRGKAAGKGRGKGRGKGGAKGPAVASPPKVNRAVTKWAAESRDGQASPPAELFEKPVQRAFLACLIDGTKPRMVGTTPHKAGRRPKAARKSKPARKRKSGSR